MTELDSTIPQIDTSCNVGEFFRELVGDAARRSGLPTSSASESYLASLLADCARSTAVPLGLLEDSLTLQLARALEEHGARRFEQLRTLGDGVLYLSGFFGEHLERRGLEPDYVSGLGATAYGRAASMLRRMGPSSAAPDVLRDLSDNFGRYVQLVTHIAEQLATQSVRDHGSLLDLYERWVTGQLTGPSSALSELLVAQGLIPQRGSRTVH